MTRSLSLLLLCLLLPLAAAADEEAAPEEAPPASPAFYSVLFHTPGPDWKEGVPFREQPGIGEHVGYMRTQLERGTIVMGGPFLDDSGGMMICRERDLAKAKGIAESDPAVKSGLLSVSVVPWMVAMSSVRDVPGS